MDIDPRKQDRVAPRTRARRVDPLMMMNVAVAVLLLSFAAIMMIG
jgi:hypothetical protein